MKKRRLHYITGFTLLFLVFSNVAMSQYLHRKDKLIVDGEGKEVILRGMGLGGWMLQEGYMLETNSFANPQHEIRAKIVEVIGEENTVAFYDAWLKDMVTRRDVDSLASWGFNSIRLPMHYNLFTLPIEKEPVEGQNTWLDKGFAMTDSLLKWCAANQMYLILDLHATPGGQGNDAAISDYDKSKPSLWQSERNKQKTIALWRKLAERYATEKWIGGYDLINETNWPFDGNNQNGCNENTNGPLKKLLQDITTAIREVDKNHIIYIEGNCWANNHNGLLPFWDNNMVLSFHKYWNYNDQNSIQGFINLQNQHNIPLWLGESGENSNVWFRNAIALMESNHIGWAWWPLKKVGSVVNPLTVVKNPGYDQLLNYWKNSGTKPSVQTAKDALMQLTENLKIENNIFRPDVVDAMFRQVKSNETIPYKHHVAPGVVAASDYDLGRYNHAYVDKDTATYHVSGGEYTAWNNGWSYRNDGVDIETSTDNDPDANGFDVGWTNDGEWLQYTIDVDSTAAYKVEVRYATPNATSSIKLLVNGTEKVAPVSLPATGGYNTWSNFAINDFVLYKGSQKVRLYFEKGGANISYLRFTLSKKIQNIPFKGIGAATLNEDGEIELSFNKAVDGGTVSKDGFSATVNDTNISVTSVSFDEATGNVIIDIDGTISDADVIKLNYQPGNVHATDGTSLETFSNLPVSNTLPIHYRIPGKVEAENFFVNQGLSLENTTDTGGGQNIGYTNAGDYLEYRIRVDTEGSYKLEARVACNSNAGKLKFEQLTTNGDVLQTATLDVPVSGGWQTWKSVNTKMNLSAGAGVLRVTIVQPEFNLNWIRFSKESVNGIDKSLQGVLKIYPNPADSILNIEVPEKIYKKDNIVTIRDSNGHLLRKFEGAGKEELKEINVSALSAGLYVVEFETNVARWSNKFVIE